MKTYKNLWEKIVSEENLRNAYKKARKGKSRQIGVKIFEEDIDGNLKKLKEMLETKTFKTSKYKEKMIFEPKQRLIYKLPFFPDRIAQHALMAVLIPYLEKLFIYDSYACVNGKGQIQASKRCIEAVRRNKYVFKGDIKKFYPSINQKKLSEMYHKKFKDKDLLWLIDDIIFSFPGGYNCPIGNYTSQWSGNFYLTELDYYVKHELKIKDYMRYCDDFILFHDDKKYLHECRIKIEKFLWKKLELKYSKANVFSVRQGVDFVGYRHFDNYILLRKSTSKRMKKRIKALPLMIEKGTIDRDKARSVVASIRGWTKHANSYNFRKSTKFKELEALWKK